MDDNELFVSPLETPSGQKRKKNKKVLRIVALVLVCIFVGGVSGSVSSLLTMKSMGVFTEETSFTPEIIDDEDIQTLPPETVAPIYETTAESTTEEITDVVIEDSTTAAPETTVPQAETTAPDITSAPVTNPSKSSIYASAVHSVVGVASYYEKTYINILGQIYKRTYTSTGTGFYVSSDGYVITNCHVVENGETIKVTDYDGESYYAKLVATMSDNDVAILKIEEKTPSLTLGSSGSISVGDDCMIIGNPYGNLSYTYTDGMISYTNRTITTDSGYTINVFQTNAAINSGNSGGPVFDETGKVIGIATAKYSSSEGLSFFIPIDDAKDFIFSHIK